MTSRGITKPSLSKHKIIKVKLYNFQLYSYDFFIRDNPKKLKIIDMIFEWGFDSDADDFLELLLDKLKENPTLKEVYKLDYKASIYLFMVSLNPSNIIEPVFITELKDLVTKKTAVRSLINLYKQHLKIIKNSTLLLIKSYNSHLISLKEFFEETHQTHSSSIILYRGFNHNRYKELLDDIEEQIKTNPNEIIVKSVLSSSLSKEVALKFLGRYDRRVIWKINVPNNKFGEFKYSFVKRSGGTQSYHITYATLKSANYEYELLLNFGLVLKFIKKEEIIDGVEMYEMCEFEFVKYNTDERLLKEFDKNINDFIDRLITTID